MDTLVIIFFEFIGGVTRFLFVNAFYKITGKNKAKKLEYFLEDSKDNIDLSKGYFNAIIGFVIFVILLFGAYLLYSIVDKLN